MSLTSFITTYIYTPMLRTFKNLTFHKAMSATLITMFIAGLWHGAGWGFIVYGCLHGIAIVINHYWRKTKIKLNRLLAWFITFNFVNIAFVFFRAKDFEAVGNVLGGMVGMNGVVLPGSLYSRLHFLESHGISFGQYMINLILNTTLNNTILFYSTFFISVCILFLKNSNTLVSLAVFNYAKTIFSGILLAISVFFITRGSEFLYFRF
jgi:alginate O-acetyltransferase complex protein AlgI